MPIRILPASEKRTVKRGWKLTTKPTKKSTLTGTDTTRGGGPDEGNVGYNKDLIYRHGKHRKKIIEEMEKRKKRRPEAHTPYRAKKAAGGVIKAGKRFLDFIKTGKHVDKHGVKTNVPKAAERITGKPHVDHGKRKKIKKGESKGKKGGRTNFRGGGRTNLLEELGRVEAEPSNRNRRAEVSRIHGELNRGYKSGGRAKGPNRPRPQGPHMWVRGNKRKKYASGGVVMAGKKVGCQIK